MTYRSPPAHVTLAAAHFARARDHEADAAWMSAVAFFFLIAAYREAVTGDSWGMASALCAAVAMIGFAWGAVIGMRRAREKGDAVLGRSERR